MTDQGLQVLLEDYVAARDDERAFRATQTALASLALTLLGGLAALVNNYTLPLDEKPGLPQPVLASAPAIPMVIFALFVLEGTQATVRVFYMRDLESRLRAMIGTDPASQSPGYVRLSGYIVGLNHGDVIFRLVTTMVIGIAIGAFGAITVLIGVAVGSTWAAIMAVCYVSAFGILVWLMWKATGGGPRLYQIARQKMLGSVSRPRRTRSRRRRSERSLTSYLLLPRYEDLQKGLFLIAGYLLAGALGDGSGSLSTWQKLSLGVWAWGVLEYLTYQSRYQWNDIRGAEAERAHPRAAHRGRLPVASVGTDRAIKYSSAVAAWRIGAAVILALGNPLGRGLELGLGILAIWVLAIGYEAARERGLARLVLFLVTLGYPLRFCLGLAVAGYAWRDWGNLLAVAIAVATLIAFGSSFVGLTWTLEAVDLAQHGRTLSSHHEWLLSNSRVDPVRKAPDVPPLADGYRLLSWPNVTQLLACTLGGVLAHLLASDHWGSAWPAPMIAALTCAAAIVAVGAFKAKYVWMLVAGETCAIVVLALSIYGMAWAALALPAIWVLFMVFYIGFRTNTYLSLKETPKKIVQLVVAWLRFAAWWIGKRPTGSRPTT